MGFLFTRATFSKYPGPSVPMALAALLGAAMWLGAAVGFVRRGLDAGLRLRPRPATAMLVLFLAGVAIFLAGLRLA